MVKCYIRNQLIMLLVSYDWYTTYDWYMCGYEQERMWQELAVVLGYFLSVMDTYVGNLHYMVCVFTRLSLIGLFGFVMSSKCISVLPGKNYVLNFIFQLLKLHISKIKLINRYCRKNYYPLNFFINIFSILKNSSTKTLKISCIKSYLTIILLLISPEELTKYILTYLFVNIMKTCSSLLSQ